MIRISSVLFLFISIVPAKSFGQNTDEIKRNSLGLQVGIPSIAGVEYEYISSALNNRYSFYADLTYLPNVIPYAKTRIHNASVGINRYFKQTGSGPYIGLAYSSFLIRAFEIDDRETDVRLNLQWIKGAIGYKTKNKLYVRGSVGYSIVLFNLDEANEFLGEAYGVEIKPTLNFLHLPNLKFGLGYSF